MSNSLEKWWMDNIVSLGCIISGCTRNEVSCHHINSGSKRMGDLFTLPLCMNFHHEIANDTSVGQNKKAFKFNNGCELWILVNKVRPALLNKIREQYSYNPILRAVEIKKAEDIFKIQDERIYYGKIKYVLQPPQINKEKLT